MDDVTILVDLAEKGHNAEIVEYNRIHVKPHVAKDCNKCLALARARRKVEQAEEYNEMVVLYIP